MSESELNDVGRWIAHAANEPKNPLALSLLNTASLLCANATQTEYPIIVAGIISEVRKLCNE